MQHLDEIHDQLLQILESITRALLFIPQRIFVCCNFLQSHLYRHEFGNQPRIWNINGCPFPPEFFILYHFSSLFPSTAATQLTSPDIGKQLEKEGVLEQLKTPSVKRYVGPRRADK